MARKKEVEKTPLKKGKANFELVGIAKIGKYTFSMEQKSQTKTHPLEVSTTSAG